MKIEKMKKFEFFHLKPEAEELKRRDNVKLIEGLRRLRWEKYSIDDEVSEKILLWTNDGGRKMIDLLLGKKVPLTQHRVHWLTNHKDFNDHSVQSPKDPFLSFGRIFFCFAWCIWFFVKFWCFRIESRICDFVYKKVENFLYTKSQILQIKNKLLEFRLNFVKAQLCWNKNSFWIEVQRSRHWNWN